jgi:hypothetical protein
MANDPLWRCPACGREFANRNQSHACGHHDLDHHFSNKPPAIRALFNRVVHIVESIGPVRILPEKTRIAFQVRMSFAQITPRRQWLDGHVVLARRLEHPRFRVVQTFSPKNHLHAFRIRTAADLDEDFVTWIREAYAVGEQKHLSRVKRRPVTNTATPARHSRTDRRGRRTHRGS